MKIAIDIQGVQSEGSSSRGIGRYSLDIIKNIIHNFPENEYILVANSALKNVKSQFSTELSNNNVSYFEWFAPIFCSQQNHRNHKFKILLLLRSFSLKCLDVDIILITSFIEGYSDNCFTDLDFANIDTPIVSIFYDLIPLINSNIYLEKNQDFSNFYRKKLNKFRQFDALLSISESSTKEAIKYLPFEPNKVFNISSACDSRVFNQTSRSSHKIINNFSIDQPFLMYSGASDPRKNVKGLLEAFSKLSIELSNYKLLLVGKLLSPEIDLIDIWIKQFNIDTERVIKLGYVSSEQLVTLYQNCNLFIFPSFHEGFGLPVLEAMSCGAPVIGSNCTSIPEVIRSEKALFDPNNINQLVKLIEKSLLDNDFNNLLRENSKEQCKKFSWVYSSSLVINAFKKIIRNSTRNSICDSWSSYIEFKNQNLSELISNLKSLNKFNSKQNLILIKQVSASIDLINISLEKVLRKRFFSRCNIYWRVEGPFDSNYSLAILNSYFIKAIFEKVKKLTIHLTEGLGDYQPNMSYIKKDPTIYSLYKSKKKLDTNAVVLSRNLYPPRVDDMYSFLNMLHAYGWEESVFPLEWVNKFNSSLQCITVMSSEVKKILIDNGVYIPIKVCGLGLDHINEIQEDKKFYINAKSYKILHISSCFPRKGVDILLKSYSNAFTESDNVSLIIKTFDNPHNNIEEQLNQLKQTNNNFPDVRIIKNDLSLEELKSLYLQCNVLVAPSRGEGFGLPIGEAMRLGLPVITTDWGGQKDFCNASNCWLVDYEFSKSKTHFNLDFSYWAEPSINHLTIQLKNIYSSSYDQISLKTNLAKQKTSSFLWHKVAENNISFACDSVFKNDHKNTKIGWVSTWNSNCGIASYSHHLVDKINSDVIIFNPSNESHSSESDLDLVPSWNLDDQKSSSLDKLLKEVIDKEITTLVIQFNYGFFDFNEFSQFIDNVKGRKINLIIFLHSTNDPVKNSDKSLDLLKDSLKLCDRLMVHTISDLNRLKSLNLTENVCLFPHGILDFTPPKFRTLSFLRSVKITKNRRICSYGFCLPNKGFFELIEAVSILNKKKFNIKLDIFSAIYNSSYLFIYKELDERIRQLNMQKFISINCTYMTDEETLNALSNYDLCIFPYQHSNESSSAAVRHGLASRTPVLVTPLPIFEDVSDFVNYLPGTSPYEIADGISEWYLNLETNAISTGNNIAECSHEDRLNKITFSKLAYRLFSIIKSLEVN